MCSFKDLAAVIEKHGTIVIYLDIDGWDRACNFIYEVTKTVSHLNSDECEPYPFPQCLCESPPPSAHLKWLEEHRYFYADCY